MNLNAIFSERVVLDSNTLPWSGSPSAGVQRRLLHREGEEVARATSIVRYAPGSQFPRHVHELGEELFVLDGELQDESGSYGPGTYIRNPAGSAHAPSSVSGCTLFVKLRQLDPNDTARVVVRSTQAQWLQGLVDGLTVLPLAGHETERTALVRWAAGTRFKPHRHFGGEEVLVIAGVFEDEHGRYRAGAWMRSPHLSVHQPFSVEGCTILVKTGHLPLAAAAD